VVEYLHLRDKLQYLDIILPVKWGIIFFNIGVSIYLILSLFKNDKGANKKPEEKDQNFKNDDPVVKTNKNKKKEIKEEFTDREKMFLHKKTLKSKADVLVDDK